MLASGTFSKINTRVHNLPFPFAVLAAKGTAGLQKFYFVWRVRMWSQRSNRAHRRSKANGREGGESDFIGAEMDKGIGRGRRSKGANQSQVHEWDGGYLRQRRIPMQRHSPYNTSWFSSTDQTSSNKSPASAFATCISSGTFVKGLSSSWEFSKSVYIKNSEHIVPTYILSIQKLHLFVTVYYSSHWQTPPCEPDLPRMLGIWKA